ncbi:MAG: glycerol acyltransferase [Anaerolineae bacterium]|nr:MAG: glycerol acyltransferase [Anaerolineae bacterium]
MEQPWWQRLARLSLRLRGWKLVGKLPPTRKYLIVGAFHTTNWDFPIALAIMGGLGIRPRWIGKDSLFRGAMGGVMHRLGGIPVVRGARRNFVAQVVDLYNRSHKLVIAIAPEGTRRFVDHWKTGFYYIALGAKIPIAFGFADYPRRVCGVGGYFTPSGDPDADLDVLRAFYADKVGKFPHQQGTIRFLPRKRASG